MTLKSSKELFEEFLEEQGLLDTYNLWLSKQGGRFTEVPQKDDLYYFVDSLGDVIDEYWCGDDKGMYIFRMQPLWKTSEDARRYRDVLNYIKSKSIPFMSDRENWFLQSNVGDIGPCSDVMAYPNIDYFESKEICEEIINTIGNADLLKYYFLLEEE